MENVNIAQITLEILGSLFCMIIVFIVFIDKLHVSKRRRILGYALVTTAVLLLCDSFAYVFRGDTSDLGIVMTRATNFIVFLLQYALLILGAEYYYAALKTFGVKTSRNWVLTIYFFSFVSTVLLVVTQFTGFYYTFDEENRYHRNNGVYLSIAIQFIGLFLCTVQVMRFKRYIDKVNRVTMVLYLALPLVATVTQTFIYGFSLINISITASLIILYIGDEYSRVKRNNTLPEEFFISLEKDKRELEHREKLGEFELNSEEKTFIGKKEYRVTAFDNDDNITMRGMQIRLIITILSGIILSIAVIGSIATITLLRMSEKDSDTIIKLLCENNVKELDSVLDEIEQSVNIFSMHVLGEIEDVSKLADKEYFDSFNEEMKTLGFNIVYNTANSVAIYLRFDPSVVNGSTVEGFFLSKSDISDEFINYEITDIAKYDKDDREHVAWWYEPIEAGEAVWLPVYNNLNNGIQMISYIIPLYMDGKFVAVAGMDVSIELLTEMVEDIKLYDSGYAMILSEEGEILYSPVEDNGFDQDVINLILKEDDYTLKRYEGNDEMMQLVSAMLRNKNMWLAVTVPELELDGTRNNLIIIIILVAIFITILITVITVYLVKRMIKMAYTDVLTGAGNTRAYEEAKEKLNRSIRDGDAAFGVAVFDVNNLKLVNDNLGHLAGDQLLKDGYALITEAFPREMVYRVGGDEFVVILKRWRPEFSKVYLDRLRKKVWANNEQNEKFDYSKNELPKTVVASGLAMYDKNVDSVYGDVFDRADDAMYANKTALKKKIGIL